MELRKETEFALYMPMIPEAAYANYLSMCTQTIHGIYISLVSAEALRGQPF